jgi:hypothetical protein
MSQTKFVGSIIWKWTTSSYCCVLFPGKAQQPPTPDDVEGNAGAVAISRKMAAVVVGYQDGMSYFL